MNVLTTSSFPRRRESIFGRRELYPRFRGDDESFLIAMPEADDFDFWRDSARTLVQCGVPPEQVEWSEPGAAGKNYVLRADGRRTELGPFDQTEMGAGDVFVIETPGGGGFGAIEYGSKAKKQGQKQKHE